MAAVLAGAALLPVFLPWLPTTDFSSKGFILGDIVALPFAFTAFESGAAWRQRILTLAAYLFAMPPVTAYLTLNFTDSTSSPRPCEFFHISPSCSSCQS